MRKLMAILILAALIPNTFKAEETKVEKWGYFALGDIGYWLYGDSYARYLRLIPFAFGVSNPIRLGIGTAIGEAFRNDSTGEGAASLFPIYLYIGPKIHYYFDEIKFNFQKLGVSINKAAGYMILGFSNWSNCFKSSEESVRGKYIRLGLDYGFFGHIDFSPAGIIFEFGFVSYKGENWDRAISNLFWGITLSVIGDWWGEL